MNIVGTGRYKNKKSLVLESEKLKAEFLPEQGGKLASFLSKETGYEYLVQRQGDTYKEQEYDGVYVEGECSGFDDMFPTIDECCYEEFPWKGIRIPDHGEEWSLKWKYEILKEDLYMYVYGIRLPYKLEKWASLSKPDTLRIDYKLTNNSNFDMDFLWAAHPMINIEEGTKILLPDGCDKVITAVSKSGRMGSYGDIVCWPEFTDSNGNRHRLDISRAKDTNDMEKYYFKDQLKEGWCALEYPDDNYTLSLTFPIEKVPYLGILMNENGWDNLYNIFLEPCTAPFDRFDVAKLHGKGSKVKANGEYSWHLNLRIEN